MTDASQQPDFSHLQYGQHAIHSPYAGNPPSYDTHLENQNPQQYELPPLPESLPYHGQPHGYQASELNQSGYPLDH
uniref:Uncharacterized protein n=1 Tax=Meloidogyne floridensis TaxID=298350 RepID=A0A915NMG3_9BILA